MKKLKVYLIMMGFKLNNNHKYGHPTYSKENVSISIRTINVYIKTNPENKIKVISNTDQEKILKYLATIL